MLQHQGSARTPAPCPPPPQPRGAPLPSAAGAGRRHVAVRRGCAPAASFRFSATVPPPFSLQRRRREESRERGASRGRGASPRRGMRERCRPRGRREAGGEAAAAAPLREQRGAPAGGGRRAMEEGEGPGVSAIPRPWGLPRRPVCVPRGVFCGVPLLWGGGWRLA